MMMGLWFLASAFGQLAAGKLGLKYPNLTPETV
jgi:dipeptide/tripeptide permease